MDYTSSNNNVVHAPTGHTMHKTDQTFPTVVSDDDLNGIIWELMHLLDSEGIAGVPFDPNNPNSYNRVRTAILAMIPTVSVPTNFDNLYYRKAISDARYAPISHGHFGNNTALKNRIFHSIIDNGFIESHQFNRVLISAYNLPSISTDFEVEFMADIQYEDGGSDITISVDLVNNQSSNTGTIYAKNKISSNGPVRNFINGKFPLPATPNHSLKFYIQDGQSGLGSTSNGLYKLHISGYNYIDEN
jgi:hypothetical protein